MGNNSNIAAILTDIQISGLPKLYLGIIIQALLVLAWIVIVQKMLKKP